jgi:FkbM family methyltransferase
MGMVNWMKWQFLIRYNHMRARRNLVYLRDPRAMSLRLDKVLFAAAQTWPEILPWKPATIIDVGAHRGEVAEQVATLYSPSFMALVEPLPEMMSVLESKSFAPKQQVFSCALGRKDGKATLNVIASIPSSSLLEIAPGCDILFHRPMEKIGSIEISVRTLDGIFAECGLEDLDLLKVDVQGYEIEVFAGGASTLRKTRFVVTEVSFFEHYKGQPLFGEIYAHLHGLGFELRGTFGYSYNTQGLPLQCDAVFINRAMYMPH